MAARTLIMNLNTQENIEKHAINLGKFIDLASNDFAMRNSLFQEAKQILTRDVVGKIVFGSPILDDKIPMCSPTKGCGSIFKNCVSSALKKHTKKYEFSSAPDSNILTRAEGGFTFRSNCSIKKHVYAYTSNINSYKGIDTFLKVSGGFEFDFHCIFDVEYYCATCSEAYAMVTNVTCRKERWDQHRKVAHHFLQTCNMPPNRSFYARGIACVWPICSVAEVRNICTAIAYRTHN